MKDRTPITSFPAHSERELLSGKVVPIRAEYRPRLAEVLPFPVAALDVPTLVWIARLRPVYRFMEHPLRAGMGAVRVMSREIKFALWTLAGLLVLVSL
jgi:hypothetical protein